MRHDIDWLRLALRLILGGVFIYAAWDKFIHPDYFAENILDYEMVPKSLVNLMAVWLTALELVLGICLLAGFWTRSVALLLGGLCAVFIGAIAFTLLRGIPLHACGCFSTESGAGLRDWLSLWQEGLIMIACVFLYSLEWGFHKERLRVSGGLLSSREGR
jgi:putative oxidoreductase